MSFGGGRSSDLLAAISEEPRGIPGLLRSKAEVWKRGELYTAYGKKRENGAVFWGDQRRAKNERSLLGLPPSLDGKSRSLTVWNRPFPSAGEFTSALCPGEYSHRRLWEKKTDPKEQGNIVNGEVQRCRS